MVIRQVEELHFFIKGRVQGVGFRHFVSEKAPLYGLCGWIRNVSDGSVEVRVRGRTSDLVVFLQECAKGCFMSLVSEIIHTEIDEDLPELEEGNFLVLADA